MKLARENERQMIETFQKILVAEKPAEIDLLIQKLDHLAHERRLAIGFEKARLLVMGGAEIHGPVHVGPVTIIR